MSPSEGTPEQAGTDQELAWCSATRTRKRITNGPARLAAFPLDLRQRFQAGRANIAPMERWDWLSIAVCVGLIGSALTLVAIVVSLD